MYTPPGHRSRLVTALCCALLVGGCGEDSEKAANSGSTDTGTGFVPDTTAADTTVADTGANDSGANDTGANDTGENDTGENDTGANDTGANDTSANDTGTNDTAAIDAAGDVVQIGPKGGNGCADGSREGFLDDKAFPKIAACGGAWDIKGIHHGTPKCNRMAGNDGKNAAGKGCNVEDLCADGWRVCYGKADVLSRNPDGCARIMDGVAEPGFFLARTSSTGAFNCSQDSTKFGDPGTVNDLFGCGNLGCGTVQGSCKDKKQCDPTVDCPTCPGGQKCLDKSTCAPSVCFPLNRASHNLCKTLEKMPSCTCKFTDPAKTKVSCSPSSGGCGWCRPVNYYEKLLGKTFPAAWDCGTSGSKEAVNVVKKDVALGGVLCCQL